VDVRFVVVEDQGSWRRSTFFLSYAHADRERVLELRDALVAN